MTCLAEMLLLARSTNRTLFVRSISMFAVDAHEDEGN